MTLVVDNVEDTLQADGDLLLLHGDGSHVKIDGCTWPSAFGSADDVLITDGSGVLSWQKYARCVVSDTTYYISPTGNDTTGDGSSNTPWATVGHALDVLAQYRISHKATVTLVLMDGSHTIATPITLNHCDGLRIRILGQNVYTKSMSSVQSSSGSAGAWSVIINMNSVENIAVGDYVLITGSSGGTRPQLIEGCHEVTAVDSEHNRITIASKAQYASAPSGAVAATVKAVKTVLACTTIGFDVAGGSAIGLIDKLVLVGPGVSTNVSTVCGIRAGVLGRLPSLVLCSSGNLGISNFAAGIYSLTRCHVHASLAVISGCYHGVSVTQGGSASVNYGAVTGCSNVGIAVFNGSTVYADHAGCYGNNYGVYAAGCGYAYTGNVTVLGNSTDYSPSQRTVGNEGAYIDY